MVSRRSGSSCNKCRPSLFIEHVWHRLSDRCAIKERMFRASVINLIVSHNNQHIPHNGQHISYRVLGSFNATVYVRCCDLTFSSEVLWFLSDADLWRPVWWKPMLLLWVNFRSICRTYQDRAKKTHQDHQSMQCCERKADGKGSTWQELIN